ncbi:hypothetical protein T492DRAFT_849772 [Pavlovales sp. CCMP2436]|nr:hypothetical protein T492DRAFT_849772 [Pavlovales sp. CCMP2436]
MVKAGCVADADIHNIDLQVSTPWSCACAQCAICLNTPPPPLGLYAIVMRACAQRGRIDDAFRLLDQMKERKIAPEIAHIAALLLACERNSNNNNNNSNNDDNIPQTHYYYMINILIIQIIINNHRRGDPQRSIEILDSMPTFNLKPTTLTYNMAMSACAKRGELPLVEKLLAKMDLESDEAKPDIVSLNTVLDA